MTIASRPYTNIAVTSRKVARRVPLTLHPPTLFVIAPEHAGTMTNRVAALAPGFGPAKPGIYGLLKPRQIGFTLSDILYLAEARA